MGGSGHPALAAMGLPSKVLFGTWTFAARAVQQPSNGCRLSLCRVCEQALKQQPVFHAQVLLTPGMPLKGVANLQVAQPTIFTTGPGVCAAVLYRNGPLPMPQSEKHFMRFPVLASAGRLQFCLQRSAFAQAWTLPPETTQHKPILTVSHQWAAPDLRPTVLRRGRCGTR